MQEPRIYALCMREYAFGDIGGHGGDSAKFAAVGCQVITHLFFRFGTGPRRRWPPPAYGEPLLTDESEAAT